MASIAFFGSSTTFGQLPEKGVSFAESCKRQMIQRNAQKERTRGLGIIAHEPYANIYNYGQSATTLRDTIEIIEELEPSFARWRKIAGHLIIAVIQPSSYSSGINIKGEHEELIESPDQFAQRLKEVSTICARMSVHQVWLGSTPVNEAGTDPYTRGMVPQRYLNSRRTFYDGLVKQHAIEHGAAFIDLWTLLKGDTEEAKQYISDDNLHPNSAGHDEIAKAVMPVIDSTILQVRASRERH